MLALALLVCGCVFASLAGPAVSLHVRTEALQQALRRLGALGTAVEVDASWTKFPQVFADQPTLTESNFSLATSTIAGGLAYSLPVAVGWGGLTTEPHVVISGAARLPPGYQPELEVTYRDQLTSYVQTVAGRVVGTAVPRGAVGVTVTQRTAARFGLHPGSRLELPGPAARSVSSLPRLSASAIRLARSGPRTRSPRHLDSPRRRPSGTARLAGRARRSRTRAS